MIILIFMISLQCILYSIEHCPHEFLLSCGIPSLLIPLKSYILQSRKFQFLEQCYLDKTIYTSTCHNELLIHIYIKAAYSYFNQLHFYPHFNDQNSTNFDYEGPDNPHFQIFYNHHLIPFFNHSSIVTPYNFQNLLIIR